MDPSRSKSNAGNDSERKFIFQILWLSLAGGTASFTRVSSTRDDLRRNPSKTVSDLVIHLNSLLTILSMIFSSDVAFESSSRFYSCPIT